MRHISRGGMGDVGRSVSGSVGNVGRGGHSLDDGRSQRGLADDGVESVDGVGGVVDGTTGAIGLGQRVLASDNISVAGLVLVLVISSHGILDVVRERVLGMGIILDLLWVGVEELKERSCYRGTHWTLKKQQQQLLLAINHFNNPIVGGRGCTRQVMFQGLISTSWDTFARIISSCDCCNCCSGDDVLTLTAIPATPMATALQATPKVARMTKQVNWGGGENG